MSPCHLVTLTSTPSPLLPTTPCLYAPDLLNAGRMELDGLLEEYKRRSATGNWVSDWADGSVHEIDKPKWY